MTEIEPAERKEPTGLQGAAVGAFAAATFTLAFAILFPAYEPGDLRSALLLALGAGTVGGLLGSLKGWWGVVIGTSILWVLLICGQLYLLLVKEITGG